MLVTALQVHFALERFAGAAKFLAARYNSSRRGARIYPHVERVVGFGGRLRPLPARWFERDP